MRELVLAWAVVVAGCSSDGGEGGCTKDTDCKGTRICQQGSCVDVTDGAAAGDLSGGDLAGADLAGTIDGGPGDVTSAHGTFYKYVLNSLTLPMQRSDFSIDLNGDGKTDNQLGSIIGALAAQNLDMQGLIDLAIASGVEVHLVDLQTADVMLSDDAMVGAALLAGKMANAPKFDGTGTFVVDQAIAPGQLFGRLVTHRFTSNDPVTTKFPVDVTVELAFLSPNALVQFPLHGAEISFTTGTDMASGKPGLLDGQLHGSIKNADIQNSIIPAMAMLLSARVAGCKGGGWMDAGTAPDGGMACTGDEMQILLIFDTGGCSDNGVMAKANDGVISNCEVAMNQIIKNVLLPDVQIYDAKGNYAPNPQNAMKDSLSIGLGFTAVKATF